MAKKPKVNIDINTEAPKKETTSASSNPSQLPFLFGKKNYQFMILGLVVIFLGFILMMGKNNDVESLTAVFPADDIYSVRRIVIAPIVVIIGFLIELYSIILIKKNSQ